MYLFLLLFWPSNIQKPSRLYAGPRLGLISAYNLLIYITSHGVEFGLSGLSPVRCPGIPRGPVGFIPKASTGYVAAHPCQYYKSDTTAGSMATHQVRDVAVALELCAGIIMQLISG